MTEYAKRFYEVCENFAIDLDCIEYFEVENNEKALTIYTKSGRSFRLNVKEKHMTITIFKLLASQKHQK